MRKIFTPSTTIIANACYGGRISRDLDFPYNSPTVGLYFQYPDYITFLSDLEAFTRAPLTFRKQSKYEACQRQQQVTPWTYPIGVLKAGEKEIEIQFLHYHSEEEARDKWERRCKRINFNDIVVLGVDQDGCTEKDAEAFLHLPFEKKYFFTSNPWHSLYGLSGFCMDKRMKFGNKETVFHKVHIIYSHLKWK